MNSFEYSSLLDFIYENQDILEDIKNKYITLLSLLTKVTSMTNSEFVKKVEEISQMGTIIICHTRREKEQRNGDGDGIGIGIGIGGSNFDILGSGTVVFEPKIIHGGSYIGHIEDVVVHNLYRSHGIAKEILNRLSDISEKKGCYKIILDCAPTLENFYEKNGFTLHGVQMSKYF